MAIKRIPSEIDVVTAAYTRIRNIFSSGKKIYFSFSGGKDSLCLAQLLVNLQQRGEISLNQLEVVFIDEEAIFPCIEETVKEWRKRFMMLGAKFTWFCIEVKHFNCFNSLENDESFICWDSLKEDVWVRRPPSFAVRSHPFLKPRIDKYQDFSPRYMMDGINMIGVRAYESLQRLKYLSLSMGTGTTITKDRKFFPIYDWHDSDVWLFLKENHVKIPDIYLFMYQTGVQKNKMRVSQFFSIDTAGSLVQMNEYYPGLMERINKREPNAYIASLYWDTEMFGRKTRKRKQLEQQKDDSDVDYKAKFLNLVHQIKTTDCSENKKKTARSYFMAYVKLSSMHVDDLCKCLYEGLVKGDPKGRTLRAIYQKIGTDYINRSKQERGIKW